MWTSQSERSVQGSAMEHMLWARTHNSWLARITAAVGGNRPNFQPCRDTPPRLPHHPSRRTRRGGNNLGHISARQDRRRPRLTCAPRSAHNHQVLQSGERDRRQPRLSSGDRRNAQKTKSAQQLTTNLGSGVRISSGAPPTPLAAQRLFRD